MTDENDLTVRILREIQATQAEHTRTLGEHTRTLAQHSQNFAAIRETLTLHGLGLQNQTAMFEEVVKILQQLRPLNVAEIRHDLAELAARVGALEGERK